MAVEGVDTAVYVGNRSDYSISRNSDGSISVVDNNHTNDGSDTLYNIAYLQFIDQTVAINNNVASDFTGNGVSDVLLQNGGTVVDWLMNNGVYQSGNVLTTAAAGWDVVGTGDFTGNGVSDVLLQNGGRVVDWIMNNGVYQSGNVLTTAAAGWDVVGTGDFTGNGTDDVLLQNGGSVVDWIMNNGVYQSGNVLTTAAAGWNVVGHGGLHGQRHGLMLFCRTAALSSTGS